MKKINRRKFLQSSLTATAGLAVTPLLQRSVWSQVRGANDDIRIAVAGLNGRGNGLMDQFHGLPGVRVVALCEPDRKVLEQRVKEFTGPYKDRRGNTRPARAPRLISASTWAGRTLSNTDSHSAHRNDSANATRTARPNTSVGVILFSRAAGRLARRPAPPGAVRPPQT